MDCLCCKDRLLLVVSVAFPQTEKEAAVCCFLVFLLETWSLEVMYHLSKIIMSLAVINAGVMNTYYGVLRQRSKSLPFQAALAQSCRVCWGLFYLDREPQGNVIPAKRSAGDRMSSGWWEYSSDQNLETRQLTETITRQSFRVKGTKQSSVLAVVLQVGLPMPNLPVAVAGFIQGKQIYEQIIWTAE